MKKILRPSFLVLGLAMLNTSVEGAELPDFKLSDFEFGEHLFGDEVTMASLKGRVVVIEKWGVQ